MHKENSEELLESIEGTLHYQVQRNYVDQFFHLVLALDGNLVLNNHAE